MGEEIVTEQWNSDVGDHEGPAENTSERWDGNSEGCFTICRQIRSTSGSNPNGCRLQESSLDNVSRKQ